MVVIYFFIYIEYTSFLVVVIYFLEYLLCGVFWGNKRRWIELKVLKRFFFCHEFFFTFTSHFCHFLSICHKWHDGLPAFQLACLYFTLPDRTHTIFIWVCKTFQFLSSFKKFDILLFFFVNLNHNNNKVVIMKLLM